MDIFPNFWYGAKEHDELLKGIKENLKNINKNVLGKEVKDQNILIKIISAIKEYVKTNSPKALEKIRSVLPTSESLSTKAAVKNIKKESQEKIKTYKPKGVRR